MKDRWCDGDQREGWRWTGEGGGVRLGGLFPQRYSICHRVLSSHTDTHACMQTQTQSRGICSLSPVPHFSLYHKPLLDLSCVWQRCVWVCGALLSLITMITMPSVCTGIYINSFIYLHSGMLSIVCIFIFSLSRWLAHCSSFPFTVLLVCSTHT